MQLTQFTDLSLRLLIYLARLPEPGMATIAEIADYHQISRNHLVKVANSLTNQGFIISTRGKGGGIQLARPAFTIGVGDVVRQTEANMNLVECFDTPNNNCLLIRNCFLKASLYEAQRAFMAVLDKYTLADAASLGGNINLPSLPTDKPQDR
ncbi:BadM/Rrf2 family transcriptional regulator [Methyloprofundus sedimenti]|uniref:BadM/Rrf2 family transcriptional regulator n=1 Tax=Methyloprofundus sedimenti TaxID=1420851 RepID=A0A1V8MBC7_9GAMM|nr:Rrf2 family transcriptional regulator [Methyloprofundus sedimenti]OQK15459.1 BadM/Rrf2 family transcriptional regulator [Methyloprofundus sedimenti]OQK18633.1 BadM/Rrf2 family transcriptional regulator [Methyloprofundus sedimenti]